MLNQWKCLNLLFIPQPLLGFLLRGVFGVFNARAPSVLRLEINYGSQNHASLTGCAWQSQLLPNRDCDFSCCRSSGQLLYISGRHILKLKHKEMQDVTSHACFTTCLHQQHADYIKHELSYDCWLKSVACSLKYLCFSSRIPCFLGGVSRRIYSFSFKILGS